MGEFVELISWLVFE